MTQQDRSAGGTRRVFVVPHINRPNAHSVSREAVIGLQEAGIEVRMHGSDADRCGVPGVVVVSEQEGVRGCEVIVVFGGDGTILRAAELARGTKVPLLGVNLGHMGFLAESEPEELPAVLSAVVERNYSVEHRMALECSVVSPDGTRVAGWALNDVSIEKSSRERMIEVVLAVDDQPISEWGCDGVVCATPTGSTAYAWSAGGPVVWPDVEALVVVPISAHALFSRPLVIGPTCEVDIELTVDSPGAIAWCDGRRLLEVAPGSRVEVRRSAEAVDLARVHRGRFSDRLVGKFALPVTGWRGRRRDRATS